MCFEKSQIQNMFFQFSFLLPDTEVQPCSLAAGRAHGLRAAKMLRRCHLTDRQNYRMPVWFHLSSSKSIIILAKARQKSK